MYIKKKKTSTGPWALLPSAVSQPRRREDKSDWSVRATQTMGSQAVGTNLLLTLAAKSPSPFR